MPTQSHYIRKKWAKCQSKWRGRNNEMDQCDIDVGEKRRKTTSTTTITTTTTTRTTSKGRASFSKSSRYRFLMMSQKTRRNSGTNECLLAPAHIMEL